MNHRTTKKLRLGALTATAAMIGSVAIAGSGEAAVSTDTTALRSAVTVEGVRAHQQAFQEIADANGGTRQAGTGGHEESVAYVQGLLDDAGYLTQLQPFEYERAQLVGSSFAQTEPSPAPYVYGDDYLEMEGRGSATAPVTGVDLDLGVDASTSGCEAEDFTGFPAGNIALVRRGTCAFADKADNAFDAGASGVIIFNQGNGDPVANADRFDLFAGTLGEGIRDLPVISTDHALGVELANTPDLVVSLSVDIQVDQVTTMNLLADTPTGRADRTVVVGGHLDSVGEGPGINDNGSGTAAILETALQMSVLDIEPENRVRFAFWSGEEDGLLGSIFYVNSLTKTEIKGTALNLNFDMVGSPNAVNFVYDGDGDAFGTAGPNGSALIESVFQSFFAAESANTEPSEFDGRSDYLGFIEAGIPAGGLFTGAEGIKTTEQAALFGGTAGIAYDPCYHEACDTFANVSLETLHLMSDAIAHATLTFADTTSAVNGTAKGHGKGKIDMEQQGAKVRR